MIATLGYFNAISILQYFNANKILQCFNACLAIGVDISGGPYSFILCFSILILIFWFLSPALVNQQ